MATRTPGALVGERLREIRNARGLSLQAMTQEIARTTQWRIDLTGLARIERGDRAVNVDELCKLAYAYGVTPVALLTTRRDYGAPGDVFDTERVVGPTGDVEMPNWRVWVAGRGPLPGQVPSPTWRDDIGSLSFEDLFEQFGPRPSGWKAFASSPSVLVQPGNEPYESPRDDDDYESVSPPVEPKPTTCKRGTKK